MEQDKSLIAWHKVESSAIEAYAYDPIKQELSLEFKKGVKWKYSPVSPTDFLAFKSAPSLGSFFHKHIKDNPGITAEKL